jgi:hypothetical protein
MIDRARRAAALAVLLAAHRRHGSKSFPVAVDGPNYRHLVDAESLGWAWFVNPTRCAVTHAGLAELELHIATATEVQP